MDRLVELGCTADWQVIVGASSFFVAALALIFTILEQRRSQKHRELSCKPHLTATYIFQPDFRSADWSIKNTGLGPAIITNINWVSDKGKPLWEDFSSADNHSIHEKLKRVFSLAGNVESGVVSQLIPGAIIPAGQQECLLKVVFLSEGGIPKSDLITSCVSHWRVEIEYEDFYKNKFHKSIKFDWQ